MSINELAEKIFTTSCGLGDGCGGDFGWWLGRLLELELSDQKVEFRLRLGVAGQQQFASVSGRQMDIDHLDGGEFLQGTNGTQNHCHRVCGVLSHTLMRCYQIRSCERP